MGHDDSRWCDHELDGDDYFLAEVDDPQEPVVLGAEYGFSDLQDIDEDDQKGNYIDTNNKLISVSSIYQYIATCICYFFSKCIP